MSSPRLFYAYHQLVAQPRRERLLTNGFFRPPQHLFYFAFPFRFPSRWAFYPLHSGAGPRLETAYLYNKKRGLARRLGYYLGASPAPRARLATAGSRRPLFRRRLPAGLGPLLRLRRTRRRAGKLGARNLFRAGLNLDRPGRSLRFGFPQLSPRAYRALAAGLPARTRRGSLRTSAPAPAVGPGSSPWLLLRGARRGLRRRRRRVRLGRRFLARHQLLQGPALPPPPLAFGARPLLPLFSLLPPRPSPR